MGMKNSFGFRCASLSILGGWFLFSLALGADVKSRPNVVIILADDLGYGSVNCYGADPKLVRTPAIDRLAAEGIRFTDASTPSSVCSPTRYGLLTGRYCWRTSLQHEVLEVKAPLLIEPTRATIASMLKSLGYHTAAIGKWHLGYGDGKATDYTAPLTPGPLQVGFDYHYGIPSNHSDVTGVFIDGEGVEGLRSKKLSPFGKNFYTSGPFMGIDAPQREDEAVMDVLTKKATAWIRQQESAKPFFLYFAPVAVHQPSTPSSDTKGSSACGPYGDWIHELDRSVDAVLAALEEKGLARNTIVIFTSDNGGVVVAKGTDRPEGQAYQAGLRPVGQFRGGKHSVFEGGFRVPFIVRWPGHAPAGKVSTEMINLVDVMATLAAATGSPLPKRTEGAEDSYDVLPAFLGRSGSPARTDMVLHSADGNYSVREGNWKWIEGKYHPDTKPAAVKARAAEFVPSLYDLASDPAERKNVIEQHPEIARKLSEQLQRHRAQGFTRAETP